MNEVAEGDKESARGAEYYAARRHEVRANLMIVRDHLQEAMRAGLNSEALRHVVAAIREIDR